MKNKYENPNTENTAQEKATITIQKHCRGFLVRKRYAIHPLEARYQTNHPTFVVGNDPGMPLSLNKFQESEGKIALIATSGLRAVSLACMLGNAKHTPKIILIDNSSLVYNFWYALRAFMEDDKKAGTRKVFFQHLPAFLERYKHLYVRVVDDELSRNNSRGVHYLNQNIIVHFNSLFELFGYDYVRAVIQHTSLIKQSWADATTFVKVKNILDYLEVKNVYMYPSNIVATVIDTTVQNRILENIKTVMPALSIHTDYCQIHGQPEKIYIFRNQTPEHVKKNIFAYKYAEQCYKDKLQENDSEKQRAQGFPEETSKNSQEHSPLNTF
ncbi:hypothetical protein B6N58_05000 [Legionella micdadei]|uniref:IQ calmodulin-binding motif-containing protein n=1 Tax=Legionella micdadei TaxID=451 RepID=UPI0009EF7F82|nr:IQ calmodulin-binding motif-containing protein [Legionella micdadei]ARG97075.1 hypothetical protein B6N58_05000 [Legionella micdadei]ARH00666.1 hypothetical protein B6V88_09695 [Legionella micdadei]NSL18301.1 hypothetical protein [Legionella micdadei]